MRSKHDSAGINSQLSGRWHMCAVGSSADMRGTAAQAYTTYKLGGPVSELLYSPAAYGIDFAARDAPRPRARANPMLAVAGNTLWLLGGVVEVRSAQWHFSTS